MGRKEMSFENINNIRIGYLEQTGKPYHEDDQAYIKWLEDKLVNIIGINQVMAKLGNKFKENLCNCNDCNC